MKDIKDYLNLYIGCPFIYNNGPKVWDGWDGFKKGGAWYYENEDFIIMGPHSFKISEIKLVLRRLEDMTEEEMERVVLIRYSVKNTLYGLEMLPNGIKFKTNGFTGGGAISFSELSSDQFHYLLKQGFDLWNLIDQNLAIDAKTLIHKS